MNPCSEDIKDILLAETELNLVFAENLFVAREPSNPDNIVTIFDTPGAPMMKTFSYGENYEYPSVQIRGRGTDYRTVFALLQTIVEKLHNHPQQALNGSFYTVIQCNTTPTLLDWDDNGRCRLITNFLIQRRRSV